MKLWDAATHQVHRHSHAHRPCVQRCIQPRRPLLCHGNRRPEVVGCRHRALLTSRDSSGAMLTWPISSAAAAPLLLPAKKAKKPAAKKAATKAVSKKRK